MKEKVKYCLKCDLWMCDYCLLMHEECTNHILCNRELHLICKQHSLVCSIFCFQCNIQYCSLCPQKAHLYHNKELINSRDLSILNKACQYIDELMLENRVSRDELFNSLESSDIDKKDWVKWIEQIDIALQATKNNHNLIKRFLQLMWKTGTNLKTFPNYSFNKSLSNIHINQAKSIPVVFNSLEAQYNFLKERLLNERYALELKCISQLNKDNNIIQQGNNSENKDIEKAEERQYNFREVKIWGIAILLCYQIPIEKHHQNVLWFSPSTYFKSVLLLQDKRIVTRYPHPCKLKIWDFDTLQCLTVFELSNEINYCFQLRNSKLILFTYPLDKVYEINAHTFQLTLKQKLNMSKEKMIQLKDGRLVSVVDSYSGPQGSGVQFWDSESLQILYDLRNIIIDDFLFEVGNGYLTTYNVLINHFSYRKVSKKCEYKELNILHTYFTCNMYVHVYYAIQVMYFKENSIEIARKKIYNIFSSYN